MRIVIMYPAPTRRLPIIVLAGFLVLVCGLSLRGRDAVDPPALPAHAPSVGPTPGVYRTADCVGCHNQDQSPTYKANERDQMMCRMNEWQFYDRHDKHQLAFASLLSGRGQSIAQRLGHKQATEITACLKCHALPEPGPRPSNPDQLAEGVTCVACHGPFIEWVETHPRSILFAIRGAAAPPKAGQADWTKLDRKEKEQGFGMTDLWDPARRAETCASCHIGNHAQGKVITHAMYAAGHPPLPSFEVATFSDAQPRHWEYMREKSKPRKDRLNPPHDPRNLEQTQLIVVSSLVSLRESMRLFADEAAADKPDPIGAKWPDFARFDCYACHHELQARAGASSRQVRSRDGAPGRPTSPDWPEILIQLGIEASGRQQVAIQDGLRKRRLAALHETVTARPFGDLECAVPAAICAAEWADSLVKSLKDTVFDTAIARRLLIRLCKMASDPGLDYDSARQIAWAFQIIYHELVPDPKQRDAVIEHALADIGSDLALKLPSATEQVPIEKTLQERLMVLANFDLGDFHAHFGMIAERVK
jgi:Cytochrome c554 and c-prime